MRTFLIDDETKALNVLAFHLNEYFEDFEITGEYTDANLGLNSVIKQKPDVIFLDINMPNLSGIDLLNQINYLNIPVIFITAHAEYAIDAIKLQAFDYLLKPISLSELNRIHKKLHTNFLSQTKKENNKIHLKVSNNYYVLDSNEVIYVKSEGNYTTVCTDKKKLVISKNLKKIEDSYFSNLPFYRIHQSYIVNINHIIEYNNQEVVLSNKVTCPISHKKYQEFLSIVK